MNSDANEVYVVPAPLVAPDVSNGFVFCFNNLDVS